MSQELAYLTLLSQEILIFPILTGALDAHWNLILAQRSSATFWATFFLIQKNKHVTVLCYCTCGLCNTNIQGNILD